MEQLHFSNESVDPIPDLAGSSGDGAKLGFLPPAPISSKRAGMLHAPVHTCVGAWPPCLLCTRARTWQSLFLGGTDPHAVPPSNHSAACNSGCQDSSLPYVVCVLCCRASRPGQCTGMHC